MNTKQQERYHFLMTLEADSPVIAAGGPPPAPAGTEADAEAYRAAFAKFMHNLRLSRGLSLEQLAVKVDVSAEQLHHIEQDPGYKAPPRTLMALAIYYGIPKDQMNVLAGVHAQRHVVREDMLQYAAKSEQFEQLTPAEKKLLDEFLAVLSEHHQD